MFTLYENEADLEGVLVGQEVDDFESVGDDAERHELLAVVATLHHQAISYASTIVASCGSDGRNQSRMSRRFRQVAKAAPVDQSLNNGHLSLFELLLGITSSGVGQENGVADLDVVLERNVLDFDSENRK